MVFCWLTVVATLTGLTLIFMHLGRIRNTTLVAPALWLAISLVCSLLLSLGFIVNGGSLPNERLLLFITANSSFCPQMALFGAKRPQDRGWQIIVATLWVVLSIPVLQSLAFSSDGFFETHGMWRVFLWVLIAYGFVNHFLTKFVVAAFFMLVGQLAIFAPFLWRDQSSPQTCLAAFQVALVISLISARGASKKMTQLDLHPMDRVWHDFRDMFGMVWSLRIIERVNHLATQEKWGVQLSWSGFTPDDQLGNSQLATDVEKCLRTLLRRFVDSNWIDARLMPNADEERG